MADYTFLQKISDEIRLLIEENQKLMTNNIAKGGGGRATAFADARSCSAKFKP